MTYGQIGKMRIKIPIQDLFTKSSKIEINKVEIHLRPNGNNISHHYFEKQKRDLQDLFQQGQKPNIEGLNDEDYDSSKMNELKNLLLQVALNVKAHIKDVIIKIFLQPEMNNDSSEEVYFMLRISEIASDEEYRKSNLDNSTFKFDNVQSSTSDINNFTHNPPPLTNNRISNQEFQQQSNINQQISLKVSNINLFLLKDSSLNSKEFFNLSASPQGKESDDLKFPYSYPQHNHPTNILHIPSINTTVFYPLKGQQIQSIIKMESFEVMVEPYQIKLIGKMLDIIQSWKKQVDSLKLLLITNDQKLKDKIIENNLKWTQQQDVYLEKNNLNDDNDMDHLLFRTIAELNKTQKDSMQFFNQSINQFPEMQKESNFFNQSIMVQKSESIGQAFNQSRDKRNLDFQDFEQSGYFNQSQLGRIIDPQMTQCMQEIKKGQQSQNSKTLSLKFQLMKCGIYVLKGSEHKFKDNFSIEYSREWKYSPYKSYVSQVENLIQNQSKMGEGIKPGESKVRTSVNLSIPCSYFMLKVSKLEFNFSNELSSKKIDVDVKSFKLMDVLMMRSEQNHHRFKHFEFSNYNPNGSSQRRNSQIKEDIKDKKISSTFWKSKVNDLQDEKGQSSYDNQLLLKYQIKKNSHYCVNYLVYYQYDYSKKRKIIDKRKTHENVKIHKLLNDIWDVEKKERKRRNAHLQKTQKKEQESEYEFNVKNKYTEDYIQLKGYSQSGNSQFFKQHKFDPSTSTKQALFSMVQRSSQKQKNKEEDYHFVEKERDSSEESDEVQQPEDVYANILIDKIFINFDMKILHDIALMQCPLSKYAHYSEEICVDLQQKIPKYEIPNEIKKLIKSLSKDCLELDIKINMLSCNLLTYGFNEFFISSKEVDNIYNNYAQWGCMCEVTNPNSIPKNYQLSQDAQSKRGGYKPHYLNITLIKPEILVVQKNDLNINFNEINVFSCNNREQEFHKIIHIGRNFVLTKKNDQNELELTYPSILKYHHKKEGSKDVNESITQQLLQDIEPQNKTDINEQLKQKQDSEKSNQEDDKQVDEEQQSKFQSIRRDNLPEDTFYKDDEQNPDINQVKIGLNIGIPILELYILEDDLNILGDISFSLLTFMNIIDQFKYKSMVYKNFFENIQSKAILLRDNILIRIICSEVNVYFSIPESQQNRERFDISYQKQTDQCYRLSNDPILSECLIFHMKDMSLEILLNKEIKKEEDIKNFKLTFKMSIGVNSLMIIDNTLPNLISSNSNDSSFKQNPIIDSQTNLIDKVDSLFPASLHIYRVQSVFLRKIKQENILIYKMNISKQNQYSYQDLYNIMANRFNEKMGGAQSKISNFQSNILPKQMILAIKNIQERIISVDNQLSIQMVFKKKQHEVPFMNAKSKQQLDIRGLCLNQSVISLMPITQSNLLLQFFENIQFFLLNDKINSDVMVKNEFKEIILRDFILFRDVKIDLFPTPSCQQYVHFGQLLTAEVLDQINSKVGFSLDDRFMSPYRAILSIDQLQIMKFQKREQRDCSKQIKISKQNYEGQAYDNQVKQVILKQNVVKKISEDLDLRVNKITLDFLYQKEYNTQVDPFMIDFMFASSDQAISSLGFSKLAILFDIEFKKHNNESSQLRVDGIQIGLFKDSLAHLPYFIDTLLITLKYNFQLLKPYLEAIKKVKEQINSCDLNLQLAIFKTKVEDLDNNSTLYHLFYPCDGSKSNRCQKQRKYLRLDSRVYAPQVQESVKEQEEEEEEEIEEVKENLPNLKINKRKSSQFDESFEKINGDDYIIDEQSLREKEKFIIDIQLIKIYLYEGLDFNFTSIEYNYNINQELFYFKNDPQQRHNSERISNQNLIQQLNVQNEQKSIMNIVENYANNIQQKQIDSGNEQNFLSVRGKIQSKSTEHLLLKIDQIQFEMTSYQENDQEIEKYCKIVINKLLAENGFQQYTSINTERSDITQPVEFLHLSFYIESKKILQQPKINPKVLKQQPDINPQQKVLFINNIIRQLDFKIHQTIKINLSSQGAEFLMQFFQSDKKKFDESQSIKDKFWTVLNKNLNKENQKQNSSNRVYNQQQGNNDQNQNEEEIRVETITSIDFLYIPKISILLNNRKEGFNFSRLSRMEGFLQIINIGEFDEIEISLISISLYDKNIQVVGKQIIDEWKKEIIKNQLWQAVLKSPLIKNIAKIGEGVYDLFYLPISYYQQGMSVLDGTYYGVRKFVTNTTQESINLTSAVFSSIGSLIIKNAKGASHVINQAKNYFSDKNNNNSYNKNNK